MEIACSRYKNATEPRSGDNCEYFTGGKYVFIVISDGVGAGKIASIDSGMTCGFLKRFLLSGFFFSTSIKLANVALKLKGGEESFATADICSIDTETGEFTMAKAGAAESYIVSAGRVKRLRADGLPVGILNDVKFGQLHSRLKSGELFIMTDGAVNNGDEWIQNARLSDLGVKEICDKIVKIGSSTYKDSPSDDITAVCVSLK